MLKSMILKYWQIRQLVSFKTTACVLLPLFSGLSKAATTTSTVVLISPVNVMSSIAGIAPVISTSGGWITIRLSVPQLKQSSAPVSGTKDETTGRSTELLNEIEAEKPNLESADVLVSEEGSSLNIPLDMAGLGLKGQPIVSLNLSNANSKLDAFGVRNAVNPNPPNGYKLTVGFN